MSTRYKLVIEYDGTGLVGWQRQDNGASVQQLLEEAATCLNGEPVSLFAAGRTDAGVHATGQVAHLDLVKSLSSEQVRDGLNFWVKKANHAGYGIAVLQAEQVADDFHARLSATARVYRYRIINRRPPLALDKNHAWWIPHPLDATAMHDAAQFLVGNNDFSSFRSSECQASSPIRTLDVLQVSRYGEEIEILAKARSFLHHQVRNMVGSLKMVGDRKWHPIKIKKILESKDRRQAGSMAPAAGLYFVQVYYE